MILHAWERIADCCYRCGNCQLTVATLRDRPPPRRLGGGCGQSVDDQLASARLWLAKELCRELKRQIFGDRAGCKSPEGSSE